MMNEPPVLICVRLDLYKHCSGLFNTGDYEVGECSTEIWTHNQNESAFETNLRA